MKNENEFYAIEFGVYEVNKESNGVAVGGRCHDAPIKEGDIVEALYCFKPPPGYSLKDVAESEELALQPVNVRQVHLGITFITCYGKRVAQLEAGMGGLHLAGSGIELVTKDDTLGIVRPAAKGQ